MGADASEFNAEVFSEALTESLTAHAQIDAVNYGRLLGLKGPLASFTEEGRLTEPQLALIYFRDIMLLRELNHEEDGVLESVLENLPNEEEI